MRPPTTSAQASNDRYESPRRYTSRVTFDVAAEAYDRFMGRYSRHLAPQLADLADVRAGQRVLDVGSGPGALTAELVRRLGADAVAAVDPSTPFVEALRHRHPGVSAFEAAAESLPFDDDAFDTAIAQLVVHFMADPVAGLREMRRVTHPGGVVAACVWDLAGQRGPMSPVWRAARELGLQVSDESVAAGGRDGHLVELFDAADLRDVRPATLEVSLEHATFEEWWEPFTLGVGPAGSYVARLDPDARGALRERCLSRLGEGPFVMRVHAWAARGTA